MRRQDIQVGVEYAATAPLAYGREPRTRPRRVRFTDTRPGPWLRIIKAVYREKATGMTGSGWNTIATRIVKASSVEGRKALADLPSSMHQALIDKYGRDEVRQSKTIGGSPREVPHRVFDHTTLTYGDTIEYVDDSLKGGLPGEIYRNGDNGWDWFETLVMPADIHRTWAEVQQKQDRKANEGVMADKIAKVPEINEFLHEVGLGNLIRAHRSTGSGSRITFSVAGPAGDGNGETVLRALQDWADDRKPITRQRKPSKEAKS